MTKINIFGTFHDFNWVFFLLNMIKTLYSLVFMCKIVQQEL